MTHVMRSVADKCHCWDMKAHGLLVYLGWDRLQPLLPSGSLTLELTSFVLKYIPLHK